MKAEVSKSHVDEARRVADQPIRWVRILCFVGFALLTPFMASALWARPVEFILLGLILYLNPPRRRLSGPINLMLTALLLLAAVVYLPASWFGVTRWREAALQQGILLGPLLTPQPWLTLDAILDLIAGISWGYLLFTQRWSLKEHRIIAQLISGGILLIIVLAIFNQQTGATLSFWTNERNFGPFENRNHTANLFALGGILMLGCAYSAFRRSKVLSLVWCLAVVVAGFGLVKSYSRAGVLLLIGGALLWVLLLAFTTRDRVPLGIFAAVGISLGTLFLIKGGDTLERFNLQGDAGQSLLHDFRWLLYKDVLSMGADNPWCGIGLGNFVGIFPQYRNVSRTEARAAHPDGDWAMLQAEMGVMAVVLVAAIAGVAMSRALPWRRGTNTSLRLAAFTGAICFALHGFANVSGHILGTVVPALLVGSLAVNPRSDLPYRRNIATLFRGAGLCLATAGLASMLMFWGHKPIPGRLGVALLKQAGRQQYASKRWSDLASVATRGVEMAPMDWEFYYLRGIAAALGKGTIELAVQDFKRARFLYPNSWRIPFQQGLVFLRVSPLLAMEPWKDALNRAADVPPDLFQRMLEVSQPYPELNAALRKLGSSGLDRLISTLQLQRGKAFDESLQEIRENDPDLARLTDEQKGKLLALWADRGNREGLLAEAQARPHWQPFVWPLIANNFAQTAHLKEAYEMAIRHLERPSLPAEVDEHALEELERRFVLNKADIAVGVQLVREQRKAGLSAQALGTLKMMALSPDCPSYVYFLQAELHASMGSWREAWAALSLYDKRLQIPQIQKA